MKKIFIYLFLSIFLLTSCTPAKLQIKYDVPISHSNQAKIGKYKLGVLLFNDERPSNTTTASLENNFPDKVFEQSIPQNIQDLIIKHFQAKLGDSGNVIKLKHHSNEINEDLLNQFNRDGINLILTGNIQHYKVTTKDDFYTGRMVLAGIMGFTFVGMIFFPLLFIGNVDQTVSIDFDKVTLFKVAEPQILYQSRYSNQIKKEFPLTEERSKIAEFFSECTKDVIEKMYNELEKSAEYDFPEQMTAEKTKKIIKIKYNSGS